MLLALASGEACTMLQGHPRNFSGLKVNGIGMIIGGQMLYLLATRRWLAGT